MTLASLARQEGISYATLYNWCNKLRQQGQPVPGNTTSPDDWSAEAKLAVVAETMPLSESEFGKYYREKGLYPEQATRLPLRLYVERCAQAGRDKLQSAGRTLYKTGI
ncbi:MAG: helix-turn-helix domain-containing protein [Endozoicomonadaceae bacterium]|nr:helix-turn-helix domain-containing protein [Endozoicomonadaceae bacterium]